MDLFLDVSASSVHQILSCDTLAVGASNTAVPTVLRSVSRVCVQQVPYSQYSVDSL